MPVILAMGKELETGTFLELTGQPVCPMDKLSNQ